MKKLSIVGIILCSFHSIGQDIVVESMDHTKLLYRGYENKLLVGQIGVSNHDVQLEGIHCNVSKLDGYENAYIVKPAANAKRAQINFISNGQRINSASFLVQNLPSPSLYWGEEKAGGHVSNSPELEIRYPAGITLTSRFEIMGWKCKVTDTNIYGGAGNLLSNSLLKFTESMEKGEQLLLEVQVKGGDGIIRNLAASWEKE